MELLHCSNWIMEYDGSDEYENLTLAMVTIVMLLNDIPHVWHRLVANLEMNSYNQLSYRITKCIAQLAPLIRPCLILGVIFIFGL